MRLVITGILTLIILIMICFLGNRKENSNHKKLYINSMKHYRNPCGIFHDDFSNRGKSFATPQNIKTIQEDYIYY